MGPSLGEQLAVRALLMAVMGRRPPRDLLLHSDHGVRYCAGTFRRHLRHRGIRQSLSRKGDCWEASSQGPVAITRGDRQPGQGFSFSDA